MYEALGIVNFENSDVTVGGLTDYRPVSALSFLGRFRMIDFVLSNMTNSGIQNIQVYTRYGGRQLFEHVGRGSQYNINPKRGKLQLLASDKQFRNDVYNHDIAHFMEHMRFIEASKCPYVVIAPSYFVHCCDYSEVIKHHVENGNDITVVYSSLENADKNCLECDTLTLNEEGRVTAIEANIGKNKNVELSLETYVMERKFFIELVKKADETSALYWLKDIIRDVCDEFKVGGFKQTNKVCCVSSLRTYHLNHMELTNHAAAEEIFKPEWPILTKTNDSAPTQYAPGSKVKGSLISNGCFIEGTVENCVLGRNVVVKKGAVIKNCIISADSFIGENAKLENVVVDKDAIVNHVKKLSGTADAPIYVKRADRI